MISVQQLGFHYAPEQPLFDKFDIEIKQGELFGLVGPNGAGKSTLIALICGLFKPLSGSIQIDGQDIEWHRNSILQKLAVVPQDYAFYPKLSAIENLQFFVSLYPGLKNPSEAIERAINMTGIGSFAHRLAKDYSGGMKRRLNLAIGLLNQPSLLILDEPTVGIDPQSRHFILQAIREINLQGTTVLYTSHYMEEVEQLCHRVSIMDHGRILTSGSLDEILNRYARLKIRLANSDSLDIAKTNPVIKKLCEEYELDMDGNLLSGDVKELDKAQMIINQLNEHSVPIEHIEYGKQSLESLFFELTDTRLREG